MTLAERLAEYVRACFTGLWVQSAEHHDALAEVAALCRRNHWSLATWDFDRGLALAGQSPDAGGVTTAADPLAAVRALGGLATPDGTALLVLVNFHRFLGSPEVVQALDAQITAGKQARTFVVVLSPVDQVPVELEKQFVILEHDLPGRDQLEAIARGIAVEPGELPDGDELVRVLDAASGLTRFEAEGAYSLSLVRHGRVAAGPLWELKSGMLKKSGLLTLHRGGETFADLGGLGALKAFCSRALRRGHANPEARPCGVLLLGVPGTGKSAFARTMGNETGRPTLVLDIGALLGSLVGQTEQHVRQALRIADAMGPLRPVHRRAREGAQRRRLRRPDRQRRLRPAVRDPVDLAGGPPDRRLLRRDGPRRQPAAAGVQPRRAAGRGVLPRPAGRRREGADLADVPGAVRPRPRDRRPGDTDWTGAKIRSCRRLAALLDVPLLEAAQNIVPVAVTAGESVERLRNWAGGRCLAADRPGVYTRGGNPTDRPGRDVRRGDPSAN